MMIDRPNPVDRAERCDWIPRGIPTNAKTRLAMGMEYLRCICTCSDRTSAPCERQARSMCSRSSASPISSGSFLQPGDLLRASAPARPDGCAPGRSRRRRRHPGKVVRDAVLHHPTVISPDDAIGKRGLHRLVAACRRAWPGETCSSGCRTGWRTGSSRGRCPARP